MDAEFKNKKEVVFDGKDVIFNVDGLEGLIEEHNKRSWWERAERIELKTEE